MRLTEPIVITHAVRTPIGKFLGSFRELSAADLGVAAVTPLLAQAGCDPADVQEVIMGNARQAGGGPNMARQIAIRAGVPQTSTAWTVNMACGSGLKSVFLAAESILLGRATIAVAGGAESMTRVPFFLEQMRLGYGATGEGEVVDGMYRDGFFCPLSDQVMGRTAETLAEQFDISRDEQDEFAVISQHRAEAAWTAGKFGDEIVGVGLDDGGQLGGAGAATVIDRDEHPRFGATVAGMQKLPPVFKKDGTVHAGNSSGITDGAAALLVTTQAEAERRGWEPLARIEGYHQAGVDPRVMGLGPVPATQNLFDELALQASDVDLIELNEAFAAQVIACNRELQLPQEQMNVNGGAIALGHPIGATGARILVTMLHEMRRRGAARGLATLCISGGLGLAGTFVRETAA
ncbi:MAG: thiolase family protein [Planctomycetota bacterium]|jgi:acetyl-CoA C-acetyltransferase